MRQLQTNTTTGPLTKGSLVSHWRLTRFQLACREIHTAAAHVKFCQAAHVKFCGSKSCRWDKMPFQITMAFIRPVLHFKARSLHKSVWAWVQNVPYRCAIFWMIIPVVMSHRCASTHLPRQSGLCVLLVCSREKSWHSESSPLSTDLQIPRCAGILWH